jgi:GNAT superfamily N-acetyltransferase
VGNKVLQSGGREFAKELVVRKATAADASPISALFKRAFAEFEALYTPTAFVATVLPDAGVLIRLQEGPVWVVEKRHFLIGTVGAICMADSVLVRGMAVDPAARGLGIGKSLLDQVESFARQEGVGLLALYTTAFLNGAIHLYQGAGFSLTGENVNPNGTELLRMVKALAS